MRVVSLHPGVTRTQVESETGFELIWPDNFPITIEPTQEELDWIHKEIDVSGAFLNGNIF
jgi:hypothetical protein